MEDPVSTVLSEMDNCRHLSFKLKKAFGLVKQLFPRRVCGSGSDITWKEKKKCWEEEEEKKRVEQAAKEVVVTGPYLLDAHLQ